MASKTQAVQQADLADGKLSELVVAQLCKTKMCGMFLKGKCTAKKCRFAHSPEELRAPLDLTKTAMCRMFARGKCDDQACNFAHGEQELRVTNTVYKTQLCNFHQRGFCKKGVRCRHAHGEHELRSFQTPARSPEQEVDIFVQSNGAIDDEAVALSPKVLFASEEPETRKASALGKSGEGFEGTPPHSATSFSSGFTPEKSMPVFPGLQSKVPKMPEPMKVALHASQDELSPTSLNNLRRQSALAEHAPATDSLHFTQFGLTGEPVIDQMARAAQIAKVAELELQAAQFKAHQQMRVAAEIAASAQRSLPQLGATKSPALGSSGCRIDELMEILRQVPTPLAPSSELASNISSGSSSSKDVPPNVQSLQSQEASKQKNKIWLI